jgi:hypothetical protein
MNNFCVYLCVSSKEKGYRIIRCFITQEFANTFVEFWNKQINNQTDLLHVEAHRLYQELELVE